MTVAELIDHLSSLPQDAQVVYALYSEFDVLDACEIAVKRLALWKGKYLRPNERHWPDGKINLVTVVVFPGN